MNSERTQGALLLLKVKTLGTPAGDGGRGGKCTDSRTLWGSLVQLHGQQRRTVQDDLKAFVVAVGLLQRAEGGSRRRVGDRQRELCCRG